MDTEQATFLIERGLWIAVEVCCLALLVRLWRTGLIRTYRYFGMFAAVHAAQTAVLFFIPPHTDVYAWVYLGFSPVVGVFAILAALELYGLVLSQYPGIGSLGRWVVLGGMIVAFTLSSLSLYLDLAKIPDISPILLYLAAAERGLNSALLLFLFLVTVFLVWFPVPLSRNTVVHSIVMAVFFATPALLLLFRNTVDSSRETMTILNLVQLSSGLLCLIVWLLFLTPAGENVTVVFGHRWRPGESERLVRQLDELNEALLSSARSRRSSGIGQ